MPSIDPIFSQALGDSVSISRLGTFGVQVTVTQERQELSLSNDLLLSLVQKTPLLLFRGFNEISREKLLELCARDIDRDLLHWDFGPMMELRVHSDPKNYLFSTENVPFHWDGAFHRVPSYLVFNCLQAPNPAAGGETLFCSSEAILADASPEEQELWSGTQLVYETEKKAHYGGKFRTEMVDRHPKSGKPILRYAEPVETKLNPVSLQVEGRAAGDRDALIRGMKAKLYDPAYCYSHRWKDGDFLIADNHALLHGRNAFLRGSPRHIRRVQIL